ncbi:MAG: tyrosine-type recombinase/integrase, partial [Hyphomicrobiales bacterium]|nr:tyrosine-type recombinase/integrase [Hyphomicrobiales bacterium]
MARLIHKLTAREVATLGAGKHGDGGNLFLIVSEAGARKWLFIYNLAGKRREAGLGSAGPGQVSLAQARRRAADMRALVVEGKDPLAIKAAQEVAKASIPTFGEYALNLVDTIESGFRNAKHRQQWRNTLVTYCKPIWASPIDKVDTAGVLKCLTPIWRKKAETASRLRGRIERVIDAARAQGLFAGANPAIWKGHLAAALPKHDKLARGHHAALPYDDVAAFMARLRASESVSALALEFCILTAARSSEVMNMTWGEVDLEAKVWTVPAKRMKAGREHRVPLSGRAVAILARMAEVRQGGFVFAGRGEGKALSSMAFNMLLRRMQCEVTAHGFRSSFSDWASEVSSFSGETREA